MNNLFLQQLGTDHGNNCIENIFSCTGKTINQAIKELHGIAVVCHRYNTVDQIEQNAQSTETEKYDHDDARQLHDQIHNGLEACAGSLGSLINGRLILGLLILGLLRLLGLLILTVHGNILLFK